MQKRGHEQAPQRLAAFGAAQLARRRGGIGRGVVAGAADRLDQAATAACVSGSQRTAARCPAALTVACADAVHARQRLLDDAGAGGAVHARQAQRRFGHAAAVAVGGPAREALLLERVVEHRDRRARCAGRRERPRTEFIGWLRHGRGGADDRMIDNPASTRATLHDPIRIDQARHCACSAWRWPSPAAPLAQNAAAAAAGHRHAAGRHAQHPRRGGAHAAADADRHDVPHARWPRTRACSSSSTASSGAASG